MGFYRPEDRQMTKTLAHEAAHHFTGMHETYGAMRAQHETVAKAVAFVCTRFGLNTSDQSVPYIAGWTANKERFRAVLGTIQGVSSTIIDRLESYRDERPSPLAFAAQPATPPPPAPSA